MTTYVQFNPSPTAAFTFQATLDGQTYLMSVPWNIAGQRWYLTCASSNGTLVFHIALTGSPAGGDINLVSAWFEVSTLVFRADTQQFEITP